MEELQRLAAALLALLLLPLVLRRIPEGAPRPARGRTVSTIVIVAACLGLLFGVLPLAALVLLIVGIVMKTRTTR